MPMPIHSSDPRVKRTRQLLQQAFQELLREKGFNDITVQDVADKATVNRATFYAHFTDKFDLMDTCLREFFQQMLAAQLPDHSGWSVENLRVLVRSVFAFLAEVHHDCAPGQQSLEPMFEIAVQDEIETVLRRWLQPYLPAGQPGQTTLDTALTVTSWAIFGTAVEWARNGRSPAAEMARQVVTVVLGGLGAVARVPTAS